MKSKILLGSIAALVLAVATLSTVLATGSNTIADFCDSSSDHGTSASCKEEAEVTGATCPAGQHVTDVNCSLNGNACTEGGNPGSWCSCSYNCKQNPRSANQLLTLGN